MNQFIEETSTGGQLISKQNCLAVTSPKKRGECVLFNFWEKLRLEQFLFRDLLTFRL